MKKKNILLLVASVFLPIVWVVSLAAAPVTPEQIKTAVETFISLRYPATSQADIRTVTAVGASRFAVSNIEIWMDAQTTVGFITHLSPGGYILMRADDLIPPLKLYSEQGEFSALPPDFLKVIQWELAQELAVLKTLQQTRNSLGTSKFANEWLSLLHPETNKSLLRAFSEDTAKVGPLFSRLIDTCFARAYS